MKKTAIILAALSAAVFSSCNKESDLSTTGIEPGFMKASFKSEAGSKAFLDGKTIKWDSTDYLTVYSFTEGATDPAVGNIFTKTGTEKTSNAEFAGTIVENAAKAYAIYPTIVAAATSSTTSALKFDPATETFTTVLPGAQELVADTFSAVSPILACKGDITLNGGEASISGTMKNACSFIKFTIANSSTLPIRSITVKSLNGAKLSGIAEITFDENGNPVATGLEASYVSGFTADGSAIPNGTYYLCVLPVDVSSAGLKVSLSGKNGRVYEFTTAGVKMERGDVYNIGTVDSGVTANPKLSTVFLYNPAITAESSSRLSAVCDGETFYYYFLKKSGTCFLVRGEKDYIETPALEGKTLKEVNAFFKNHNANASTSMGIKNATGTTALGTEYLTGTFIATTSAVTSSRALKFFQSKSGTTYYFHKFELGRNGDRESPRDDLHDPAAGTAYQIRSTSSNNCLVQMFELVYESDSVVPPTPSADATITAAGTTGVLPGETTVTIPVSLSGCYNLTASVKSGATLSNVSLSTTDSGVTASFTANASGDPKTVQSATIVLNATPADGYSAPSQVEATITQAGILCLEFSNAATYSEGVRAGWTDTNLVTSAQITSEVSSVYKTLAGNEYTIKDFRFYIKNTTYMTVTGGSATPYGYMILPAIENMTLKKIAVDFKAHNTNYKVKFVVKDGDNNQLGNTLQNATQPTADTESIHYVILNTAATGYDADNVSDKTIILDANGGSPQPNTAYKLIQNAQNYNCLMLRLKLYYE